MKKLPYFKTIRGRIISITSGITLMITIITVAICFFVFQSFLMKNQLQSAEFNLQLVANSISSDMKDLVYLSKWCCSNSDMLNYLETFHDKDKLAISSKTDKSLKPTALSAYNRLKEEFYNTKPSDYITRLIISSNNSRNILQIMSNSSSSTPYSSETLTSSAFFNDLYQSGDYSWLGFVQDPFFKKGAETPVLPIVRPIYNEFSSDVIGWNYISISSDLINNYIKDYPMDSDSSLYLAVGGQLYQLEDNQIRAAAASFQVVSDITDADLNPDTIAQVVRLEDGSERTVVARSLGMDMGYLYQLLSVQQMHEQRKVYLLLVLVICLIIFSLGAALVVLLNHTINRPVACVKQKIVAISQGDFSRDETIEWDHEIGDIGKGINNLSKDIVNLMDKRIDDEKQKKDLEYQILQSQINPHFLYNTLNSIKWMATIQGVSGIAEMTTALARLMKSVAKGTGNLVTLKEELDLVKDYFLIQQYRYGGSITIEYQIGSEDLYQCRVHRFSLQPIIENALFHGIEPKGSVGRIVVEAHEADMDGIRNLQISITDNGIGMTPETIRNVLGNSNDSKTKADFFKQVGINNVNQRMKHEFGPCYGITIESVVGEYTTAILLIPYRTQHDTEKGDSAR